MMTSSAKPAILDEGLRVISRCWPVVHLNWRSSSSLEPSGSLRIDGPRYPDGAAHGSGCTHSAALAAFLARGEELPDAARWAREIASEAVGHGLRDLGAGAGPVDVFGIAHNQRR